MSIISKITHNEVLQKTNISVINQKCKVQMQNYHKLVKYQLEIHFKDEIWMESS